jgi:hypothetical protein
MVNAQVLVWYNITPKKYVQHQEKTHFENILKGLTDANEMVAITVF